MKKLILKKSIQLFVFTLFVSPFASAQQVQFGQMIYGGTGCTSNAGDLSQKPILQIQGGQGRVRFAKLSVDSRTQTSLFDRKSCQIRLPVMPQAGYQVGLRIKSALGTITQSKAVSTTLSAQMGWVGLTPQSLNQTWTNSLNQVVQMTAPTQASYLWTKCSSDGSMLTVNMSVLSNRQNLNQLGLAKLSDLKFDFVVRPCN